MHISFENKNCRLKGHPQSFIFLSDVMLKLTSQLIDGKCHMITYACRRCTTAVNVKVFRKFSYHTDGDKAVLGAYTDFYDVMT